MFHLTPRNPEQEKWLAEVGFALAQAERLTGLLASVGRGDDTVLAAVQAQIMGLRQQVEWLRRVSDGGKRSGFDPNWMQRSVWCPPEQAR